MRAQLLSLLALLGCTSQTTKSPPEKNTARAATCLARYELGHGKGILDEQRRSGAFWDDFAERYPAATIDPTTHHPVAATSAYRVAEQPFFWFTPDYGEAVVDATLLGDLQVVDATGLAVGKQAVIGTLTERGRETLRGRELLEFLLKSDTILTYIHIGSQLCLLAEVDDASSYRAELTGEHEYYTNDENHDPFAFSLEISARGHISITGAPPKPLPVDSLDKP